MEHSINKRVYEAKNNILIADALIQDYLPFIKAETSKTIGRFVLEGEDDELSIAMIGFHEAIESYSSIRGSFLKYASLIMHRKLIDYYRKESRHNGQISLDSQTFENSDVTMKDLLIDPNDSYHNIDLREATKQEISELAKQLKDFGLTLTDISDNCPKQNRTLTACQKVLTYAEAHTEIIDELKRTKRLPLSKLVDGTGVERKTLERHRKYILALLIIFSNGYEIIRDHLHQVFKFQKGGWQ